MMIKSSVLLLSRPRGAVINVQVQAGQEHRIPILSWTDNIWRLDVRVIILTTQGLMRLISRNL